METAFLTRLLRLRGVRLDGPVVDTAALARAAGAVRAVDAAEPGLEDLAGRLGLPVHTPHQALGDALTTAVVFLALAARLEQGEPHTVSSLAALSRRHALR